jgi:streptogramin lyase
MVLGSCATAENDAATVTVVMNEVTTIAASYAMSGFATDATDVSSSNTLLAKTGIANAFLNASNLADNTTGSALTTPIGGSGHVPRSAINSLANILAACNESGSLGSTNCSTLFSTATSDGTVSGTLPSDVATAAINIAHYPSANVTTLDGLMPTPSSPFPYGGSLSNFTLAIEFGTPNPIAANTPPVQGIAIDGSGNVWLSGYYNSYLANTLVTELSSTGAFLSPSGGYGGAGLAYPEGIAIDTLGNVWIGDSGNNQIVEMVPTGSTVTASACSGGGLNSPFGVAIDSSGYIWAANNGTDSVSEFDSSCNVKTPSATGDSDPSLTGAIGIAAENSNGVVQVTASTHLNTVTPSGGVTPISITSGTGGGLFADAVDNSSNVWIVNANDNSVTKILGTSTSNFTGGGLSYPHGVAIDGAGNAWIASEGGAFPLYGSGVVTEFSNTGSLLSGSSGFVGTYAFAGPTQIAVDGSGDVWVVGQTIQEMIGAAAPVVTPLAFGAAAGTLGTRP